MFDGYLTGSYDENISKTSALAPSHPFLCAT